MARDLNGKVIAITGASAGIGAATAVACGAAGMKVVLSARRADQLEAAAERVRDAGGEALVVPCDVASDDQVQRLVDDTVEAFGRLDVMFANAGYGFLMPVEHLDPDAHEKIFDVNYFGTVRCVNAALPVMKKQNAGHIVITSSIVGRVGLPFYAHYSATKAAQDALGTALRLELEPYHIDVSVLYPIGTKTEFFEVSAKLGGRDTILENTPEVFMQTPQHVAKRVVKCLRRPCPEIWPARWAHFGSSMATLFPRLARMGLRKHANKDRKVLREMGV